MKRSELNTPEVLYKVEIPGGCTHYVMGSMHQSLGVKEFEDLFELLATTVVDNLADAGSIRKVYFEADIGLLEDKDRLPEGHRTGLDYKVFAKCREKGIPVESLEVVNDHLELALAMKALGGNRAYRFATEWPKLSMAGLSMPGIIAANLFQHYCFGTDVREWSWSKIATYSIAGIGLRMAMGLMYDYICMKAIELRMGTPIRSLAILQAFIIGSYARCNNETVAESDFVPLKKEDFLDIETEFSDLRARNERFADVMVKAEPSLFCYGIAHNVFCDELPSVLQLLPKGSEVTAYPSLVGFKLQRALEAQGLDAASFSA